MKSIAVMFLVILKLHKEIVDENAKQASRSSSKPLPAHDEGYLRLPPARSQLSS